MVWHERCGEARVEIAVKTNRVGARVLAFVLLSACEGVIGPPGGDPREPGTTPPGTRPPPDCTVETGYDDLHRLSSDQLRNTLRDLFPSGLGDELGGVARFPETTIRSGFANDAVANRVDERTSNDVEDYAEAIADHVAANARRILPQVSPCIDGGYTDATIDGCIDTVIAELGPRAYRRPLSDEERARMRGLYDTVRTAGAETALVAVLEFVLQAPAHLYRSERGDGTVGEGNVLPLTDHEIASRLSYFFWNTMPDEELFGLAAEGELRAVDRIEAEALRLSNDDRVMEAIHAFHRDWLRLFRIRDLTPGGELTAPLHEALLRESDMFVDEVFLRGDGTFATLMTTDRFPIDAALASHYGVAAPATDWTPVSIPNRRGLLTTASTMTAMGRDNGKNTTVMRGVFILGDVLCVGIPPFPDNVDVAGTLASATDTRTARGRLAPTLSNSMCTGCHTQINPHGYALERYDSFGRYREVENGAPIDASGTLAAGDARGDFADSTEYVAVVAGSEQAQRCYVRHWYRFAMGRRETAEDECAIEQLSSAFIAGGGQVRELMVSLATSDAFRTRRVTEVE
jgi:hypothetical protein